MKTLLLLANLLIGCGSISFEDKNGNKITAEKETESTETTNEKSVSISKTKRISITPDGCTSIDGEVFEKEDGFTSFVVATCDDSTQLYAKNNKHNKWKMISDCQYGVVFASTTMLPTKDFISTYSCRVEQSLSIHAKQVSENLVTNQSTEITSIDATFTDCNTCPTKTSYTHKSVWNSTAEAVAIVTPMTITLVDVDAQIITTTELPTKGTITEAVVTNGKWLILQNTNLAPVVKTIINSDGSIEDSLELRVHREGASREDAAQTMGASLLLSSGGYSHGYRVSSLSGNDPSPLFAQGESGILLEALQINSRFAMILENKGKSLILKELKITGIPEFVSQKTISKATPNAKMTIINDVLTLVVTVDGQTEVIFAQ